MGKMMLKGKSYTILVYDYPRVGKQTLMGGGVIAEVYDGSRFWASDGFAHYIGDKPPTVHGIIQNAPAKVHWFSLIPQGSLLAYDEG